MDEDLKPSDSNEAEEKPQVFSVHYETGKHRFSRRRFVEAAGTAAAAAALSGCGIASPAAQATAQAAQAPASTATTQPTDTPQPTETFTPSPTVTLTPTPTATFTPTPVTVTVTVKNQGARVRTGPGTNYPIIGSLAYNTPLVMVAKLADNSWFKVRIKTASLPNLKDKSKDEIEGWIRADQVALKGQSTEQLAAEVAPPTATPLPNQSIPPGEKGIRYQYTDPFGNVQNMTLPCGSAIPEGAVCVCNCVATCSCDGYVAPTRPAQCSCDSEGGCSCNQVCTCDEVHYWYPN